MNALAFLRLLHGRFPPGLSGEGHPRSHSLTLAPDGERLIVSVWRNGESRPIFFGAGDEGANDETLLAEVEALLDA